jgi:hypothetical protein
MTPTEFASFKYQHPDQAGRSQKRRWFVYGSLGVALLVMGLLGWLPGLLLLVVPLVAWLNTDRELLLGPRYLLCGKTIVYYANVKRMTLLPAQGKLRVVCTNGQSFVLEREKFPTSARKANKIAKNKAAKFDKVSAKIIEKVRKASTNVDLSTA